MLLADLSPASRPGDNHSSLSRPPDAKTIPRDVARGWRGCQYGDHPQSKCYRNGPVERTRLARSGSGEKATLQLTYGRIGHGRLGRTGRQNGEKRCRIRKPDATETAPGRGLRPAPVHAEEAGLPSQPRPNLDDLRFFAFFLVYLQHGFGAALRIDENQKGALRLVRNAVFVSGWVGVSFFFVLSGFLITYLILYEIKLKGNLNVLAFYTRRVLRIWPLYYLVILFDFVGYPLLKSLFGFSSHIEAGNLLYYLSFLGNFDVIRLVHGDVHGPMSSNITWSVAIEEQFLKTNRR